MAELTPEFWETVVVGFFSWAALISGLARIVVAFERIDAGVARVGGTPNDCPDSGRIAPEMEGLFKMQ